MLIIKKGSLKIEVDNAACVTFQDTYEGMYLKTKDGTEIKFELAVTPQVKAISQIVQKSTAKNITIDFDQKNMVTIAN